MTKLQKYLLKLLKEVDEICVANHIDYYIFAGSMLGVERNEGILPWDDDVDLIMTKENYDRFSQVMKTNIPANRVFETTETNKEYPPSLDDISARKHHISPVLLPLEITSRESGWILCPQCHRQKENVKSGK